MQSLSSRITAGAVGACAFFALGAGVIGAVGIVGVHSAIRAGNSLANDELHTTTVTDGLDRDVAAVFVSAQASALDGGRRRAQLTTLLYHHQIPAVEADLAKLQQVHSGDTPTERAGIVELVDQWVSLRDLVTPSGAVAPSRAAAPDAALRAAYGPLNSHLEVLITREGADARAGQSRASTEGARTVWGIAASSLLVILASIGLGVLGTRRLRRAIEPAQDQVEFADTLQLAEDEEEAHALLQRHLERIVVGSAVTVLNRNNSADRLEAVTALPAGSPLVQSLAHAEPRSCLAVRSGRTHDEYDHRPALLGCPTCAGCPGRSTCTPLTVGGEVIGSVLVNRATRYSATEQQQVRDSVGQAAPVLANLRNLAIAELRAATDSLTGLPNKRAVTDTLKRMVAQASRTETPLSLLMLDLDHFKDINDRFGHPVGDQALANVGAALRSALRGSDFAGRNGGEEFAVMLPDTDAADALVTAEKIRAVIAEITIAGTDQTVTASVGIATYPAHATGTERLERLADSALYIAKRSGRNRVEVAASPAPDESGAEAASGADLPVEHGDRSPLTGHGEFVVPANGFVH